MQHTPATAPSSSARPSPIPGDPYGHLSPEQMENMNRELREAEEKFAVRFQEAEAIPDDDERRVKLDGLKNSFGTKQSMIRKKYGVRLRERRTKAEIAAEKERLGIAKMERERTRGLTSLADATPNESTPSAAVSRSGWTAANTTSVHSSPLSQENDHKRRRLDESGASVAEPHPARSAEEPARKLVPVSETGSGGLSGSPATAATRDPTLPPSNQFSRSHEPVSAYGDAHRPPASELSPSQRHSQSNGTSAPNPVMERKSPGSIEVRNDDDDDSDSEMEDIPAQLPAHIKQTLTPSRSKAL